MHAVISKHQGFINDVPTGPEETLFRILDDDGNYLLAPMRTTLADLKAMSIRLDIQIDAMRRG